MNYKENIKKRGVVAFPHPFLLSSIGELLQEVHSLEGLILVNESRQASFVSISELDDLLDQLRKHPKGDVVAEMLYKSLNDSYGQGAAKPVLVLRNDGSFWLGLMGLEERVRSNNLVEHLNRCLQAEFKN